MALEFKLHTRAERVELGTIAELTGVGGKCCLIESNYRNPERQVMIVLKKADGTSTTVTCSPAVSKGLRAKEITLPQVQGFPIIETVSKDGEIINTVAMPAGGLIEFNIATEIVEYKAPVFDPSELVAF
jgi:hypothetical protein